MLSNTADTKPNPIATCHDASGSFCTGIIEAANTNDNRKMLPLKALGSSSQAGRRSGTHASSATQTAVPMNGNLSDTSLKRTLTTTLTTIAAIKMTATMNTRTQSTTTPTGGLRVMGE